MLDGSTAKNTFVLNNTSVLPLIPILSVLAVKTFKFHLFLAIYNKRFTFTVINLLLTVYLIRSTSAGSQTSIPILIIEPTQASPL